MTQTETETSYAVTIETEMVGTKVVDGVRKTFRLSCECQTEGEARASACFWAGRLTANLMTESRYKVLGVKLQDGSDLV